jgi:hypothetical protein
MCDSSCNTIKKRKRIVIYTGGKHSQQLSLFKPAESKFALEVDFDFFNSADVRNAEMTVRDFCKRLKSGDGYCVLSHPMQGVVDKRDGGGLEWPCTEVAEELNNSLKDSIGFPEPAQLRCGVFTQDKYLAIEALEEITVPTLRLWKTKDGEMNRDSRVRVYNFCAKHLEMPIRNAKGGFVIKFPFTTNGNGRNGAIKFCRNIKEVLRSFRKLCVKFNCETENIPYMMLQPFMSNRQVRKGIFTSRV